MAKKAIWRDEYWLLLLQAYLQEPVGTKPLYSRVMVDLSLELHIPPHLLFSRMCQIARLDKPRLERIWQKYAEAPERLARAVRLFREMNGFGAADEFYEGVAVEETFELDFRPLAEDARLMPAMLILILDLYFRLTPVTMVAETPEVAAMATLLKIDVQLVAEVLEVLQYCDPYLNRKEVTFNPLLLPCTQVWQRFGNADTVQLESFAGQLKEYFVE